MKPKLKLEMKEKYFGVSVAIYLASLVLLTIYVPGVFTGLLFVGAMWTNNFAFSAIWVFVLTAILISFTHLARTKHINYIYIVRGILLLLLVLNAFCIALPEMIFGIISTIATIILLVLTFLRKNEYVLTNTIDAIELAELKRHNKSELKHEIIGSILGFLIVPIVLLFLFIVTAQPIANDNLEDLKNSYRVNMPSEMATEEQCNEFLANIDKYENYYGPWQVDTDYIGKMLKSNSDTDDYWLIGDDVNFVYHLFYDDWDSAADEHILINGDYDFPDTATAKVTKIQFGYSKQRKIDLTEEEIKEIREFIMFHNYDESKTVSYGMEYFEDEYKYDILWYFEGEDAIYYEYGELIRTADGKFYLRAAPSYYTVYILSDEICEKLEKYW